MCVCGVCGMCVYCHHRVCLLCSLCYVYCVYFVCGVIASIFLRVYVHSVYMCLRVYVNVFEPVSTCLYVYLRVFTHPCLFTRVFFVISCFCATTLSELFVVLY